MDALHGAMCALLYRQPELMVPARTASTHWQSSGSRGAGAQAYRSVHSGDGELAGSARARNIFSQGSARASRRDRGERCGAGASGRELNKRTQLSGLSAVSVVRVHYVGLV